MHRDINGGSGFYHSGNPTINIQTQNAFPRPIKVKYHVVDVHMTPLEECHDNLSIKTLNITQHSSLLMTGVLHVLKN